MTWRALYLVACRSSRPMPAPQHSLGIASISSVPLALWHPSLGPPATPPPTLHDQASNSLATRTFSSFFLFLILGQNPIRPCLLYVRISPEAIIARLLLLTGRSKGGMRFLNAVTMETEGRAIATLVTATPETHTTYQVNSAFYP